MKMEKRLKYCVDRPGMFFLCEGLDEGLVKNGWGSGYVCSFLDPCFAYSKLRLT